MIYNALAPLSVTRSRQPFNNGTGLQIQMVTCLLVGELWVDEVSSILDVVQCVTSFHARLNGLGSSEYSFERRVAW